MAIYEDRTVAFNAPSDAALLAHLLEAKGVSQAEFARETELPKSTVSEVLTGKRELTRRQVSRVAAYFNVEAGAFLQKTRS